MENKKIYSLSKNEYIDLQRKLIELYKKIKAYYKEEKNKNVSILYNLLEL